jgi:hydrogenase expression/formation protein HypC
MCLAVPSLVRSIDGQEAVIETSGVSRKIGIALTPEVKVGDYVLVHTGYAISVIDENEAEGTLKLLSELAGSLE